ncbi:MAG: hypothetical protein NTU63_01315 [Candidatus Pacearchaeota archaeon]|nr:hypothetical protein [Candidatus Pacearchaeota archaeon]
MKNKILILLTAIVILQIYLASALIISSTTSNPAEVQPGETVKLDLTIKNDLNQDVEDVVVSLVLNNPANPLPFAPYQSSNEYKIDTINEDEHEIAKFNLIVFADANSGTYTIPVKVSYTESDTGNSKEDVDLGLVSIIINAKPKIDVSLEGPVLIKGTNGKITIKVVNSGLGDTKFLSVSSSQVNGIQITGSNNVYIGNIDSNDFDTADFDVFVNADALSSINLPVKIIYTDSRNNQITKDETVLVKTYTTKEAISLGLIQKNNTVIILVFLVLAVILFFVYRRIRKKARNNKLNGK